MSELYRNVDTQEWDPLMTWTLEGVEVEAPVRHHRPLSVPFLAMAGPRPGLPMAGGTTVRGSGSHARCGQADSAFTVPVAHAACERDLTGNPYLHLFHAMLRV